MRTVASVLLERLVADLAGFVVFVVLGVVGCVLELAGVDFRAKFAVEDAVHDLVESLQTVVRLTSRHLFPDPGRVTSRSFPATFPLMGLDLGLVGEAVATGFA